MQIIPHIHSVLLKGKTHYTSAYVLYELEFTVSKFWDVASKLREKFVFLFLFMNVCHKYLVSFNLESIVNIDCREKHTFLIYMSEQLIHHKICLLVFPFKHD